MLRVREVTVEEFMKRVFEDRDISNYMVIWESSCFGLLSSKAETAGLDTLKSEDAVIVEIIEVNKEESP